MMLRIGFIDDDDSLNDIYAKRLYRKDIELCLVENCVTMQDVVSWILNNRVKCMIVDYQLTNQYNFKGTELVAFINAELPDLQCVILTNYKNTGVSENLVIKNLFYERDVFEQGMDSEEFQEFINTLKQAASIFDNRLKRHLEEYEQLKVQKDNESISAIDEERMISIYKVLRAYGEVDDIPAELLTSSVSKQMSSILQSLNELIDKTE